MKKNFLLSLLLFPLVVLCLACTDSGGDDDDSDGGPSDNVGATGDGKFTTNCGVVVNGDLENPVEGSGIVAVQAIGPNVVGVTLPSGKLLVKLHGLDEVGGDLRAAALDRLRSLAANGGMFYRAGECTTQVEGGGEAVVGQVLTPDGKSFTEALIESGFANTTPNDLCNGEKIGTCLLALEDSAPKIGGVVGNFLWKPVSESDGNLAILLDPSDAVIVVNGETLHNQGPTNGRGSTARASKPGCAYGPDARVTVTANGEIYLFPGGQIEYKVPDACARIEFQ